jgi:hypothetical protein
MPFEVVMDMTLMAIVCGLNLPMVEEEHYLWIATVALVVVVADVMADYKAIVTIELPSVGYLHRHHGRI